jgi:hypothetical protein
VRSFEERAVGCTKDRPLVTKLLVGKIRVHALVDGEHHGCHGHVDVLALAGALPLGEAGQDGDGSVQARVDVGVGERVAARRTGPVEVLGCVGGDSGLSLDRRRVGHP